MGPTTHITCASCGIEFCMPTHLEKRRREDHGNFYCPNGHTNYFPGKTEDEKRIEQLERRLRTYENESQELYAQREDLIGAFKECPIPGCSFRSRKQINRSSVDMGRGIERVRHDLLEHLVRDHAGRAAAPLQLTAGT